MRYSKNQKIWLTVLSVLVVGCVAVKAIAKPEWRERVVSVEPITEDSLFAEVDSVILKDTVRRWPRKECFMFELNGVTKEELTKFPGIAEGRANAIVWYREKLGGFYDAEQLREIECMPDSLVDKMKDWVWVVEDSVEKIDVKSVSVGRMKWHPYIGFEKGRKIDSARWVTKKKGEEFTVESCKFAFTDEEWEKVKRYLIDK